MISWVYNHVYIIYKYIIMCIYIHIWLSTHDIIGYIYIYIRDRDHQPAGLAGPPMSSRGQIGNPARPSCGGGWIFMGFGKM